MWDFPFFFRSVIELLDDFSSHQHDTFTEYSWYSKLSSFIHVFIPLFSEYIFNARYIQSTAKYS